MNWLLIVVILIVAGNVVWGYRRGFLQVAYTLLEWVLMLAFIYFASPYVTDFLVMNTGIPARIEESCREQLQESVSGVLGLETEDIATETEGSLEEGAADDKGFFSGLAGFALPETENLQEFGVALPAVVLNRLMEETGTYGKLAEKMTDLAVSGISYLLTLVVALLIFHWLRIVLKLIDKIPVLNGVNRFFGLLAGGAKGILLIWIAFALIAAFAGTGCGKFLISYIYEAPVLAWLYENNIILLLILLLV